MITYEDVCKKLGFDPITDDIEYYKNSHDYEDDSQVRPTSILTDEELEVYLQHLEENKDKLKRYIISY